MERIDTIDQLDPICAPIYKSEEYKDLFYNYDNASIPKIEKQVQAILIKFGPTVGWKNAMNAVSPLENHLIKNAMKSEVECRAYMHEQELGKKGERIN